MRASPSLSVALLTVSSLCWQLFTTGQSVQAWTPQSDQIDSKQSSSFSSRRLLLKTAFLLPISSASALDMDAFASQSLSGNGNGSATMSDDEALCRFGQPSQRKGDACVRAGLPTTSAKKGGVDAYGQVDRGDFKRCKKSYELIDNKVWQDSWICE